MEKDEGFGWIGGLLLGAAAMYFLDPVAGPERRASAMDVLLGLAASVPPASTAPLSPAEAVRDPEHPAAPAFPVLTDEQLAARVRDAIVRMVQHPMAVQVESDDFIVTLRGEVAEHELGRLLVGLRAVPGVRRVETYLRTYKAAERPTVTRDVGRQAAEAISNLPGPSSTGGRLLLGLGGALLAGAGLRRGGVPGTLSAALGGILLARALVHEVPPAQERPLEPRLETMQHTVEVRAPIQTVFRFWSDLCNMPDLFPTIEQVEETENGTAHWVPAGSNLAWDTEITGLRPHRRLAWQTVHGAPFDLTGDIQFEETDGATRVQARLCYCIPGGEAGRAIPDPFGENPQQALEQALERMRRHVEHGRHRTSGRETGA